MQTQFHKSVTSIVYRVKFEIEGIIENPFESELVKVTKQTFLFYQQVAREHEAAEEKHEGTTKQQGKDKKNEMRWKRRERVVANRPLMAVQSHFSKKKKKNGRELLLGAASGPQPSEFQRRHYAILV